MGTEHCYQCDICSHSAHAAFFVAVSHVDHWLLHVCLGRLDTQEFWHVGQLCAADYH